jgi:hypothetical protein
VPSPMRSARVEVVPAVLAVAGLVVPLVGSGLAVWPLTLIWAGVLLAFAAWLLALRPRPQVAAVALVVALPILVVTAWEGGWWMLPAAVSQLWIELRKRDSPATP